MGIEISQIDDIRTSGVACEAAKWRNARPNDHLTYQESFFSQFKIDLGDPQRYPSLGELVYTIIGPYGSTTIQGYTWLSKCRRNALLNHAKILSKTIPKKGVLDNLCEHHKIDAVVIAADVEDPDVH